MRGKIEQHYVQVSDGLGMEIINIYGMMKLWYIYMFIHILICDILHRFACCNYMKLYHTVSMILQFSAICFKFL